MTSAVKLLKRGRPERDDRGRIRWKVRVKLPSGAWTSRIAWAATEAEAVTQIDAAAGRPVDGITWTQAVALWDEHHSTPGPAFRVERYRASIRAFCRELVALIGDKRLDATTRQDWQRFLDSKTHGSGRTANNARSLRQVAVWLRGRQELGPLPFLEVPRIEEREGRPRKAIPRDRWPAYIAAAKEPLRFVVEFLFLSGWRAMEAASLTEDSIRGDRVETTLKGGDSWSIPITTEIAALLDRARAWKASRGLQDRARLFLNARGRPWTKDMLRTRWKANQRAAGLPVFLVHEIRHSVCTLLGDAGMSSRQIASLTGHRALSTLDRYTHATDRAAAAATTALAGAIFTQVLPKSAGRKGKTMLGDARPMARKCQKTVESKTPQAHAKHGTCGVSASLTTACEAQPGE